MTDERELPATAVPEHSDAVPARGELPVEGPIEATPVVEARPVAPSGTRTVSMRREVRTTAEFFNGPLPPPEVLAKYSDAFAGCAERIVVMAEEQAKHRQHLERTVVESNVKRQTTAQWLAFVAFMSLCGGAMTLFWMGKDGTATGLLASTLLGFGGLYLYGQHKQEKELDDKRKPPEPDGQTKAVAAPAKSPDNKA